MDWLTERIAQRKAGEQKRRDLHSAAPDLYEALWREIATAIDFAVKHGVEVSTNGAAWNRVVRLPHPNPQPGLAGPGPELHVVLAEDRLSIRVSPRPTLRFDLDIRDGIAVLVLNGAAISLPNAVITILDPFLFPELQETPHA